MLRRIGLRARLLAAVEGAVAGAALALAALALGAAAGRTRGALPSWRLGALALVVGGGVGATLAAARRVSRVRCARLLDVALDRGGRAADRVLSALSFVDANDARPLARAELADAVAAARGLAPSFVAPARRPASLPA